MKKEKKQEFTLRITKANKTQMIVILYDMVLEYLKDSLESLEKESSETSASTRAIRHETDLWASRDSIIIFSMARKAFNG